MKSRKSLFLILGIAAIAVIAIILYNNSSPFTGSIFNKLQRDGIASLTVETDMARLYANEETTSVYQEAKFTFLKTDNTKEVCDIRIKPRGVFRKKACGFPPLKLKFDKADLEEQELKDFSSLKLVTPCQEGEDFEQLLFKEYLAYKMYTCLTEKSFRVQLVNINFVDSKSANPIVERYGFIIENDREMAKRLQADLLELNDQQLKRIDNHHYKLFTLFQYMIGNTDWNLSKQHNLKLLKTAELREPVPVPYDFDFAGLVDAPYAKPYPTLPIEDVQDRFFQYRGKKEADFLPIFNLFNNKKAEIMTSCAAFELLDEKVKEEMVQYLESFFELIKEPEKARGNL